MTVRSSLLVFALVCAFAAPLPGQDPLVTRVSWLSGCWRMETDGSVIDEQWMTPRAGMMLGMSRTARGDSVRSFEFVRIFTSDGVLVFEAHPSGQSPAEFRSKSIGSTEVIFENPAHDFPQRIIYRRVGADSLSARIEGNMGGRQRGMNFSYIRAACGS